MKFFMLYGVLFISLVKCRFCFGQSDTENYVKNLISVRISYDESCQKLKEAGLEEIIPELNNIYEEVEKIGNEYYEQIESSFTFYLNHLNKSVNEYNKMDSYMHTKISDYLNKFREEIQKAKIMLDQTPKKEPCNENLDIWIQDIREGAYKKISDCIEREVHFIYEHALPHLEKMLRQESKIIQEKNDIENKVDTMQSIREAEMLDFVFIFKLQLESSINEIIKQHESGISLEYVKTNSKMAFTNVIYFCNKALRGLKVHVAHESMFFRNEFKIFMSRLQNVNFSLLQIDSDIQLGISLLKNIVSKELMDLETAACCIMYELVNGEKRPLTCEDYVPYVGIKPNENIFGYDIHSDNKLTGVDENGDRYLRQCIRKPVNKYELFISEIIIDSKANITSHRQYIFDYKHCKEFNEMLIIRN